MNGAADSLSFATIGAIAAGGMVGAWLRWALLRLALSPRPGAHPLFDPRLATLVANLLACVLLGALLSVDIVRSDPEEAGSVALRAFGITGVCGSLSTFSTLCAEVVGPWRRGRFRSTILVGAAHLIGGPLGLQLGLRLGAHLGG